MRVSKQDSISRGAPRPIVVNGKFYGALLEGMPRVGAEVMNAIDSILDTGQYNDLNIKIFAPKGVGKNIKFKNINVTEIGLFQGFLWEQLSFGFKTIKSYTVNFTSTAPLISGRGFLLIHDAQFRSTRASNSIKSELLYEMITPIASNIYKQVATISRHAYNEIVKYKVSSRKDIAIIPNGVDHAARWIPDDGALEKYGLKPQQYILANALTHAHKNNRILFDAVKDRPDLAGKLVMFGSADRARFEALGVEVPEQIRFLGRVTDGELAALMANAALFLYPSYTEGFGLPPLEAMLLGCATICASAGAMPENCKDGAAYAAPHNSTEWKEQIDRLLADDQERAALAARGKAIAAGFTWDRAARSYLDLFSQGAKAR